MVCCESACNDDMSSNNTDLNQSPFLYGNRSLRAHQPKPGKIARYCFVVRHGQRADHSVEFREEYKGHPDPFLTEKGHA